MPTPPCPPILALLFFSLVEPWTCLQSTSSVCKPLPLVCVLTISVIPAGLWAPRDQVPRLALLCHPGTRHPAFRPCLSLHVLPEDCHVLASVLGSGEHEGEHNRALNRCECLTSPFPPLPFWEGQKSRASRETVRKDECLPPPGHGSISPNGL